MATPTQMLDVGKKVTAACQGTPYAKALLKALSDGTLQAAVVEEMGQQKEKMEAPNPLLEAISAVGIVGVRRDFDSQENFVAIMEALETANDGVKKGSEPRQALGVGCLLMACAERPQAVDGADADKLALAGVDVADRAYVRQLMEDVLAVDQQTLTATAEEAAAAKQVVKRPEDPGQLERLRAAVRDMHPQRTDDAISPTSEKDEACVVEVPLATFLEAAEAKKPGKAGGLSQWNNDALLVVLKRAMHVPAMGKALADFLNNILNNRFSGAAARMLTLQRGIIIAEHKADGSIKYRPIGISDAFLALALAGLRRHLGKEIDAVAQETGNFGFGVQNGGMVYAAIVGGFLQRFPDSIALLLDVKNAFNSILRSCILKALKKRQELLPLIASFRFLYGNQPETFFKAIGESIPLRTGVIQGSVFSSFFFILGMQELMLETVQGLGTGPDSAMLKGFADDSTILGSWTRALALYDRTKAALAKGGLEIQPRKLKVVVGSGVDAGTVADIKAAFVDRGLSQEQADGLITRHEILCGVPFGSDDGARLALTKTARTVKACLDGLKAVALSQRSKFNSDILQRVFTAARIVVAAVPHFIFSAVRPDIASSFARLIDSYFITFLFDIFQVDVADMSEVDVEMATHAIFLAIRLGGLGFHSLEDGHTAAFVRAVVNMAPLLAREHGDIFLVDTGCEANGGVLSAGAGSSSSSLGVPRASLSSSAFSDAGTNAGAAAAASSSGSSSSHGAGGGSAHGGDGGDAAPSSGSSSSHGAGGGSAPGGGGGDAGARATRFNHEAIPGFKEALLSLNGDGKFLFGSKDANLVHLICLTPSTGKNMADGRQARRLKRLHKLMNGVRKSVLTSHSGVGAAWLSVIPGMTAKAGGTTDTTLRDEDFRILILRRMHVPFVKRPPGVVGETWRCDCGGIADRRGDHAEVCTMMGMKALWIARHDFVAHAFYRILAAAIAMENAGRIVTKERTLTEYGFQVISDKDRSRPDIVVSKGDGTRAERIFDVVVRGATTGVHDPRFAAKYGPHTEDENGMVTGGAGNRHLSQANAAANGKISKYTLALGKEVVEEVFTPLALESGGAMAELARKTLQGFSKLHVAASNAHAAALLRRIQIDKEGHSAAAQRRYDRFGAILARRPGSRAAASSAAGYMVTSESESGDEADDEDGGGSGDVASAGLSFEF